MQLAHIVPFAYRDLITEHLTHMAIGPILQYSDAWSEFYSKYDKALWARRKLNWHVMLDNGAFEGAPLNIHELFQLGCSIGADELVLPDVFKDGKGTLELFYQQVFPYIHQADSPYSSALQLMFVMHGPTPDIMECVLSQILGYSEVTTLGFSYLPITQTYSNLFRSQYCGVVRPAALVLLSEKYSRLLERNIHCLGLSSPHEVVALNELGIVRSCDSSLAVKAAYAGIKFTAEHLQVGFWESRDALSRPADFFQVENLSRKLIQHNIRFLDELCA